MAEPTLEQLRIVAGWFLSAYDDETDPGYLGDNPTNERYDTLAELAEQTGVDLTEHHKALVGEANAAVIAGLPPLDCSPPPCPEPETFDLHEFRSRLSFPDD